MRDNMAYLVLAYPELSKDDYDWIQSIRKDYDELNYGIVEPHFTIVFPSSYKDDSAFVDEIVRLVSGIKSFEFCISCALINKDAFNDYWHVFLTPDKGFSNIVKLHDKLYSDALYDSLLMDIQFVPHISIASSTDQIRCKRLADDLNAREMLIVGRVKSIDIVWNEGDIVTSLRREELG